MRRVLVMGPPGSGKSTLARRLGEAHGLPVFHLDQAYHGPGWVPVPAERFRAEVERIASLPAWVIDGNDTDTLECRLRVADAVVYLDIAAWLSLARILGRTAASYGRVRRDGPAGCAERLDIAFMHFAWTWNRVRRARTLARLAAFPGWLIMLRGAAAQRRFSQNSSRAQ